MMNEPKAGRQKVPTSLTVKKPAGLMQFLLEELKGKSRTTVKSLLTHRQVTVGGHAISQFDYPLETGQTVTINWGIVPEQTRYRGIRILFEDPWLIAVEKEAGLLSIATDKEKLLTVYSTLSHHVKKEDPTARIFVLHRLDRDTSGVMLFAKSQEIQEKMQKNWQESVVKRLYVAVVEGLVKDDAGTVHSFLKENKALVMYSTKVPGEGEEALTRYRVLKRGEEFTMVELELETGRKNQIRVHMKDLGHPVTGDKKYGAKQDPIRRTCLHASHISFIHPVSGEQLTFETPVPHRFLSIFR